MRGDGHCRRATPAHMASGPPTGYHRTRRAYISKITANAARTTCVPYGRMGSYWPLLARLARPGDACIGPTTARRRVCWPQQPPDVSADLDATYRADWLWLSVAASRSLRTEIGSSKRRAREESEESRTPCSESDAAGADDAP